MFGSRKVRSYRHRFDILKQRPWSLSVDTRGDDRREFVIEMSRKPPELLAALLDRPAFAHLQKLRIDSAYSSSIWGCQEFISVDSLVLRWPASDRHSTPREGRVSPDLRFSNLTKVVLSSYSPSFHQLPTLRLTYLRMGGVGLSVGMWQAVMVACRSLQHGAFSIDDDSAGADPRILTPNINQP